MKPHSEPLDSKQEPEAKLSPRTWCTRCGGQRLGTITDQYSLDVGFGAPLSVQVEVRGCEDCRRAIHAGAARKAAEMAALRLVAFSGNVNGGTLRFLRRTIGLQSKELASLLRLGPGTISRWENGVRKLDVNVWVVVACLALELADGDDSRRTSRILEAIRAGEAPLQSIVVRE